MDDIPTQLSVVPEDACKEIELFLRSKMEELGRSGILVGISGGLDSTIALYLSVRSAGKERVRAFYIPDRDSKALHREHAKRIAQALDIPLEIIDLSPTLSTIGIYGLLPLRFAPT